MASECFDSFDVTSMLTDRAKEHIQSLGDQQLAEYVAAGEQMYELEAINFAREEFARRNLDGRTIARLESDANRQVKAEAVRQAAIASEPLDESGKVLAFIGGLLGIALIPKAAMTWIKMDVRGERRKAKDVKRFFLYGLAINIVVLVTLVIFYLRA